MSAPAIIRPQVGLMLSIGEVDETRRGAPRKLDHFRPKPGALGQYEVAADKFVEQYGAEAKAIDVVVVSNVIAEVLDVRVKWWGTSGLKGMGKTNLAIYPPEEFMDRVAAWDDEVVVFPSEPSEVPPAMRDKWAGESIEDKLRGPDDPRIAKYTMKVYAVLRIAIPKVTGLTTLCEISTTSKRSMANLHSGLHMADRITQGHIAGMPFVLRVRPTRGRYFDKKERKKKSTEFYELVLDQALSIEELYDKIEQRRTALGNGSTRLALPEFAHGDLDRDEEHVTVEEQLEQISESRAPREEVSQVRDEPVAGVTDAQLNRIAALEEYVDAREREAMLRGVFGVESAAALSPADAQLYEDALVRVQPAEDAGEPEIVEEGDFGAVDESGQTSFFQQQAEQAQRRRRETGA